MRRPSQRRGPEARVSTRKLAWMLLVGTLVGGVAGGGIGYALHTDPPAPRRLAVRRAHPPAPPAATTPTPPAAEEETLLVMASDAMGGRGRQSLNSNTDSMLLVHVDPAHHHLSVLSIPRDTRVPIAGHGVFKVNAANSWGGPDLAVQTVSRYVGVPVDHYVLVNLTGVRSMVDAIGGLDVTIPKRVHYVDHAGHLFIDFHPGRAHLDGTQVEEYLRFRHDDQGDIGRVERTQAFLVEFAHQFFTPAHFWQVPRLWSILARHSRTDLSAFEIMRLAQVLKGIDPHRDIELTFLPGREDSGHGPWYWVGDIKAIEPFLVRNFHKVPQANEATRRPAVSVANRTGLPLRSIEPFVSALRRAGYRIRDVRTEPASDESHVIAERGDQQGAEKLQTLVGHADVLVAGVGDLGSDFTVELGTDWAPSTE